MKLPSNTRPVRFAGSAIFSLAAAVAAVLACQQAHAAVLTWDATLGTTGSQDGIGTWNNLGLNNWWDGTGNVQWNNDTPDSAIFGSGVGAGAAGTVTLGSNISVSNLTFSAPGSGSYTIAGAGNTLTLVDTVISGSAGVTLNVNLAGTTGFTSTHTGTIRLAGANTLSGPISAAGGTIQLDSAGALGNSTDIIIGNDAGTAASSLLINIPNATSTTIGAGKTVLITGNGVGNNGALRGADGQSNTWAGNVIVGSVGSRISGGNAGTLNVTGVISGSGGVLFSRNSNATTVLSAVNTYSGDTQLFNSVPAGTATLRLGVDNAINRNSRLTALNTTPITGPAVVDLNGHTQWFRALDTTLTTAAGAAFLSVTNNAATTASTLTVGDLAAATNAFGGSIRDGAGTMSLIKEGVNTQILAGANTYTGTTTVNGGILQLGAPTPAGGTQFTGSNGVLASASYSINPGASFVVDNLGASNSNNARLSDTADLTFRSGVFEYRGSDQAATNSSETVRNLTLIGGNSRISIRQNTTNTATLNANQLTRSNDAIALVNGNNLGKDSASTTGVARLFVTNAPVLVGTTAPLSTGINASAKNTQIVPFLLGEATATTGGVGTETGNPNTFVTYQAGTGFRPLNPTDEFTNNSILTGNNTRITAATTASTTETINSLVLQGNNLTIANNQVLTVTSGAVLFAAGNQINGPAGQVGTLNFGGTRGMITVAVGNQTATMSAKITGTEGLVFNGPGTLGLGSTVSNYSGSTVVSSGTLVPQQDSVGPAGAVTSGPFGTSTLVFAGGNMRGTTTNAEAVIGNNISIQANTGFVLGGRLLTFTGPATLVGGTHTLTNSTNAADATITFSGSIGDGGQNLGLKFAGFGVSPIVLSGNNTYTGPTTIKSGTVVVSGSLSGTSTTFIGDTDSLATPATLRGSGTLGNVVALGAGDQFSTGATIEPGNSANVAGIMRTNAFSLAGGGHLGIEIGGITAGGESTTGHDQVIASGAVSLTGGDLKLSLMGTPSFTFGDQLFLVVNNSGSAITGTLGAINGFPVFSSNIMLGDQEFLLSYNGNFVGAGSDGIANDLLLTAVPEPSAAAAFASAFGLLGLVRRRRRG